jgi:hypothetical protein
MHFTCIMGTRRRWWPPAPTLIPTIILPPPPFYIHRPNPPAPTRAHRNPRSSRAPPRPHSKASGVVGYSSRRRSTSSRRRCVVLRYGSPEGCRCFLFRSGRQAIYDHYLSALTPEEHNDPHWDPDNNIAWTTVLIRHTIACYNMPVVDIIIVKYQSANITYLRVVQQKHN